MKVQHIKALILYFPREDRTFNVGETVKTINGIRIVTRIVKEGTHRFEVKGKKPEDFTATGYSYTYEERLYDMSNPNYEVWFTEPQEQEGDNGDH